MIANAILFGGVGIISRLISPADLGVASAFLALALAVYPVLTFRYEQAILVTKSSSAARYLVFLCLILSITWTVLLSIAGILLLQWPPPLHLMDSAALKHLPLLGPATLALALGAISQMMALRAAALNGLALSRTARAVIIVLAQVLLVMLASRSAASLIAGEILANAVTAGILMRWAPEALPRARDFGAKRALLRLRAVATRYRLFAIVTLPHALMHQGLVAVFGISVGSLYGAAAMGHYFLMRRILFGTVGLISVTIYQICLSEAANAEDRDEKIRSLWRFCVLMVAGSAAPLAMLLYFFGEPIFGFAFGNSWTEAGEMSKAAVFLIVMEPLTSALAFIPVFMKRQGAAFMWSLAQNLAGISALFLVWALGGTAYEAIFGSSVAVSSVMIAFVFWCRLLRGVPRGGSAI